MSIPNQTMHEGMAITGRILRLKEVTGRVGLARSTIYALKDAGRFPAPMKLSTRAIGWRESDIAQWLTERSGASSS